MKGLPVRR